MDLNTLTVDVISVAKNASNGTYIDKIDAIKTIKNLLYDAVDEENWDLFFYNVEKMKKEDLDGEDVFADGPVIDEIYNEVTRKLFADGVWYNMYMQTSMDDIDAVNDCFYISSPVYTDFGGCMYLAGEVILINEDDEDLISTNGSNFYVERERIILALENLAYACFVISNIQ